MSDQKKLYRIVLTKEGDALLSNRTVIGFCPSWESNLGKHEFCGGDLHRHRTSEYGGVIACNGGCNLRVNIPWPSDGYQQVLDHFNLLNQPPAAPDPSAAHDG